MLQKGAGLQPDPPLSIHQSGAAPGGVRRVKRCPLLTSQLHFSPEHRPRTPAQHGETSDRPGEAQADQHQGHRGGGERGGAEEGLQPSPALHPGEGQEHRHAQGLLLRLGSHREGSPGGEVDPNAAVLL